MNRLEKTAIVSAIATAGIASIKFAAGTMFGSIALVADAMHSFTDIIGTIAVFFGVRFSDIKSKRFPYGLYKLENLVSLFLSLLIFFTAYEIFREALSALMESTAQQAGAIAIGAALFSLIVSFILAKYKYNAGKQENSPSMLSEARHTKLDAFTTLGALIGISISFIGYPLLDPIMGIAISLLVFKAGAEILIDSAKVLLDASLDYKTMKAIERIAGEEKNVRVKELAARNSGRYIFVDLKLETDVQDLRKVNQIRKQCEAKIKKEIPRIDHLMLDIDYKKKDTLVYAVPLKEGNESSPITKEFGTAPYFGLYSLTNKPEEIKLLSKKIIANPHASKKAKRGILTAELLAENNVDFLLVEEELHKGGSYYALEDNYIEVCLAKAKTFKEILKKYKEE